MTELEDLRKKYEDLQAAMNVLTSGNNGGPSGSNAAGNMSNFVSTRTTFNTPRMEKGMTFEDYEYDVKLWMASGLVAKEKQALLLINEFPSKDERMLKKTVADAIGFDNLAKADGAQRVLEELGKILKSPTFVRLASWLEGFESVKQGSGTFDKFMTRLKLQN